MWKPTHSVACGFAVAELGFLVSLPESSDLHEEKMLQPTMASVSNLVIGRLTRCNMRASSFGRGELCPATDVVRELCLRNLDCKYATFDALLHEPKPRFSSTGL